jgi:WD40 repeat protein
VCISWNNDGTRLLVGCSVGTIQLWSYNSHTTNLFDAYESPMSSNATTNKPVKFSICEEEAIDLESTIHNQKNNNKASNQATNCNSKTKQSQQHQDESFTENHSIFKKIWEKQLANAVKCLKFSPDGSLFASYGEVLCLLCTLYIIDLANC